MRPPIPSVTISRRAKIALWTVGILIVIIVALAQLTGVYINYLWFGSVGQRDVYTTVFWTRATLFAVFGVLMALIIGGNIVIAYLLSPPFRPMSQEQQNIERYRTVLEPRRVLVLVAVCVIALFSAGLSAQGNWQTWQLWLHGGSFGVKDPQFGKDISFYAWDYPVYRQLLGFGFSAVIFAIILSVLVHYLTGAIRFQTPGPKLTQAARRHLTILAFFFVVLKAIAYWLDRFGLVFSDRSNRFTGASYTDVHAVLPSRTILFWIAVVIAVGLIASLWLRSTLLPGIAFVSMLILSILISGIYPAILQGVSVNPNASSKEAPYIERSIEATRAAYGIQTGVNVDYPKFKVSTQPDTEAVATTTNSTTLNDIRILDPNLLSGTFLKNQQNGNFFGFASKLDIDRYTVNGKTSDYIVAVRELNKANLTGDQANWINSHTKYTHGIGFVAANASTDVTNESGDGFNTTLAKSLTNDGVYYGELMPDYSIVGAKGTALEYNGTGAPVRYDGSGGVSLGNVLTRLAFAVNYKQSNFLLNDAASADGAKIIFNRNPRVAVQKIAPFLKVDSDPFPFVDPETGHIMWMLDGYTTIDNYPYSSRQSLSNLTDDSLSATNKTAQQPDDQINYIRNSVKATVDAYTGKVTLYDWDNTDPVLKAWMSVFPGLVQPKSDMPKDVLAHVRYPQDIFKVQRTMLGTYHVDDPQKFYSVSQKWTVPDDPTNSNSSLTQPPYYVLASPPDGSSTQTEFQLTSAMNVNTVQYLASYISVNSDPTSSDYGKLTVLQVPANNVQGPEQIYNTITNQSKIRSDSGQATSANNSSTYLYGNLLTLPFGNAFLYTAPLYTVSNGTRGAYPTLQRVVVSYGGKIGYGATLADALSDFLPGHETGDTIQPQNSGQGQGQGTTTPPTNTPTSGTPTSGSGAPTTGSSTPPGTAPSAALQSAYSDLQAAIARNDKAAISRYLLEIQKLGQSALTSTPTPARSSPSGAATTP